MHGTMPITDLFMSAADLGLTDKQRDALIKTLELLEAGKLKHFGPVTRTGYDHDQRFSGHFNMASWAEDVDCGTAACFGGTACLLANDEYLFGGDAFRTFGEIPEALEELFMAFDANMSLQDITPIQAARAGRSYLTCGAAKWSEAVAS